MRSWRVLVIFILMLFRAPDSRAQGFCGVQNSSFLPGESIDFKIYYTLAGMYIEAGAVTFSCALDHFNGKPAYHIVANGKTKPFYDNFYKVRDQYESYIDTGTLQPYKFIRNVSEGTDKKYENIVFDKSTNIAITNQGAYKVPDCIQDVLSAMYYARNLNFDNIRPGEKIQFSMFLDNTIYPTYVRYIGREIIRTKYGRFHAIKFKPLLIKGTLFEAGEKMTVWVSDDPNHVPLRVESPITVGKVKADMMGYKNLRSPLSSQITAK